MRTMRARGWRGRLARWAAPAGLALSALLPSPGQAQSAALEAAWSVPDSVPAERATSQGSAVLRGTVTLSVSAPRGSREMGRVEVEIRPEGPISAEGPPASTLTAGVDRAGVALPVRFEIRPRQRALLTALVRVHDAQGAATLSRSIPLHVVAHESDIHFSTASFLAIDMKLLRAELDAGRIDADAFRRQARDLMSPPPPAEATRPRGEP